MLSDSCFDFLKDTARGKDECKTAAQLLADTHHYSQEPFDYGPEIGRLREAVQKFLVEQTPETRAHLWRTARLVQKFHDRPPWATLVKKGIVTIVDPDAWARMGGNDSDEFETWARVELETRPEDYEWRKIRRGYLNL